LPTAKKLPPYSSAAGFLFFEEAKVLSTLKHPNIVEVIGFFKANSTVYMVMTYDYGLTLDKLLKDKDFTVSEEFVLTLFGTLLSGLGHIHSQHYIHLDIKPFQHPGAARQ